jgi:hypothetical protein
MQPLISKTLTHISKTLHSTLIKPYIYINVSGGEHEYFFKPYFLTNVVCYALGLVCTVGIMYFFNAAQPALLYLVPACIG